MRSGEIHKKGHRLLISTLADDLGGLPKPIHLNAYSAESPDRTKLRCAYKYMTSYSISPWNALAHNQLHLTQKDQLHAHFILQGSCFLCREANQSTRQARHLPNTEDIPK